jgi:hypothetical protein
MKDLRSSRRMIQKWHRREKATLDHLVTSIGDSMAGGGRVHPPTTSSGLIVEEQVRKAWTPNQGGLPIF